VKPEPYESACNRSESCQANLTKSDSFNTLSKLSAGGSFSCSGMIAPVIEDAT